MKLDIFYNKLLLTFCLIVAFLFSIFMIIFFQYSHEYYREIFLIICFLVMVAAFLAGISFVSIISLMNYGFLLFIGGRLISSYYFENVDEIFDLRFMAGYTANVDDKKTSLVYLIGYFVFFNIGAFWVRNVEHGKSCSFLLSKLTVKFIFLAYFIFFILCFIDQLDVLVSTYSKGYLEKYANKSEAYNVGGGIKYSLLYVLFGILVAQDMKKWYLYFFFIFIISFLMFLTGARGMFISIILFGVWICGRMYRFKLLHLFLIVLFIVLLMIFGMEFTARGSVVSESNIYTKILQLISDQGTTLGVFTYVMSLEDIVYPEWAPLSTFFPGIAWISSYIEGRQLYGYELTYPAFVDYLTNPEMFKAGFGMGWSSMLTFSMLSKKVYFIYIVLSFLLGFLIRNIEVKAFKSTVYMSVMCILASKMVFVIRSDLATVFPLIVYFFLLSTLFIVFEYFVRYKIYE